MFVTKKWEGSNRNRRRPSEDTTISECCPPHCKCTDSSDSGLTVNRCNSLRALCSLGTTEAATSIDTKRSSYFKAVASGCSPLKELYLLCPWNTKYRTRRAW